MIRHYSKYVHERGNHIPVHVEGHLGRIQQNSQHPLLPKAVGEVK